MQSDNLIWTMPRVLSWVPSDAILDQIQNEYETLLFNGLGHLLGQLTNTDSERAKELVDLIESLDDVRLRRVLAAPETSYRLFYFINRLDDAASFLRTALAAENHRKGYNLRNPGLVEWTVLGELCSAEKDKGNPQGSYALGGRVPIDLDSPYALKISLVDGDHVVSEQSAIPYSGVARAKALQHVNAARDFIKEVNTCADELTLSFTKVLVLRYDPEKPHVFASSSSGQFTGRSMLINPHRESVAGATVIDGIVHEAIHSILYMLEKKSPWLLANSLYSDDSAWVNSPWTGTRLLLRPFLQACFVWYGLLNFWSNSTALTLLPEFEVLNMTRRAFLGFTKGPLIENVHPWRDHIDKEVLNAINVMQQTVVL